MSDMRKTQLTFVWWFGAPSLSFGPVLVNIDDQIIMISECFLCHEALKAEQSTGPCVCKFKRSPIITVLYEDCMNSADMKTLKITLQPLLGSDPHHIWRHSRSLEAHDSPFILRSLLFLLLDGFVAVLSHHMDPTNLRKWPGMLSLSESNQETRVPVHQPL